MSRICRQPRYIAERSARFEITVGQMADGAWWARLDGLTHYSRSEADDPHTAVQNAVFEATNIIFEDVSAERNSD